jgi:hypothetical protein
MPIVGLICGDHAEAVTADHFVPVGRCLYVHHNLAKLVINSQDGRPAGWTVTEVMGCLRKTAILKTLDVVVDPRAFVAREVGTAWHRHMGSNGTRWSGELAGLPLSGAPDEFDAKVGTISDHKHSYSSPPRSGVWSSHRVQVSIYALLAAQEGLPPFDHGVIWYAGKWGQKGVECDLMGVDEVLDYRINDNLTIDRNIEMAWRWSEDHEWILPTTGKLTPFGKKTECDYCDVRRDCERLEQS